MPWLRRILSTMDTKGAYGDVCRPCCLLLLSWVWCACARTPSPPPPSLRPGHIKRHESKHDAAAVRDVFELQWRIPHVSDATNIKHSIARHGALILTRWRRFDFSLGGSKIVLVSLHRYKVYRQSNVNHSRGAVTTSLCVRALSHST